MVFSLFFTLYIKETGAAMPTPPENQVCCSDSSCSVLFILYF